MCTVTYRAALTREFSSTAVAGEVMTSADLPAGETSPGPDHPPAGESGGRLRQVAVAGDGTGRLADLVGF
jgi:hypothetical protein